MNVCPIVCPDCLDLLDGALAARQLVRATGTTAPRAACVRDMTDRQRARVRAVAQTALALYTRVPGCPAHALEVSK